MSRAPHARFAAAVRRRLGAAVALTATATGLTAAAASAAVALAVARRAGLPATWALVPIAAAAGAWVVARVVRRWPTAAAAAAVADARLGWDDLLTTAVTLAAGADPAAVAAVRAVADARCGGIRPSAVPVPRPGPARWTAAGLAVAATVAVATVPPRAARPAEPDAPDPAAVLTAGADPAAVVTAADPALPAVRRTGNDDVDPRGGPAVVDARPPADPSATADGRPSNGRSSDGTGHGTASSADRGEAPPSPPDVAPTPTAAGPAASAGGATAGGRPGGPDGPAGVAAPAGPAAAVPPWRSAGWPAAARAADAAVAAGTVPAADRDLVRAYFAPPP